MAYLIGINEYEFWDKLKNPKNDVLSLKRCLEKAMFTVETLYDPSKTELDSGIWNFKMNLHNKKVGLFYFAGHGVEINGEQYLIPVDGKKPYASKEVDNDIIMSYVNINNLINEMSNASGFVGIFILDCCREKLHPSELIKFRGIDTISAIKPGMFIAFSTATNSNARDGCGENGLFMKALKEYILSENSKIEDVFKNVRCKVLEESGCGQVPWEHSSLTTDFYFMKAKVEDFHAKLTIEEILNKLYNAKLSYGKLKEEIINIFNELDEKDKSLDYISDENKFTKFILEKLDEKYLDIEEKGNE